MEATEAAMELVWHFLFPPFRAPELECIDCGAQPGLLGAAEGSCNGGYSAKSRSPATNPNAGKTWNAIGSADAGPVRSNDDQTLTKQLGHAPWGE